MKISRTILVACIALLLISGPASAKDNDIIQLQADVLKLQQTVQKLQDSVDAKNALVVSQVEKIADQVNNLGPTLKAINDLVGTIRTDNATAAGTSVKSVTDTRDALVPLITDIQKSVGGLKESVTGLNNQMKSLSEQVASMKPASEPLPTCKDYKQGADRSFNSNYLDDAVSGYRDFLKNCAGDARAPEVQFQVAESYYLMKKFDQAVTEYDIFLQKNPSNDKTASALLRKGLAHLELKQTPEAKKALTSVTTDFPGTPEAASAAAKLKELGAAAPAPAPGRGGRGTRGQ